MLVKKQEARLLGQRTKRVAGILYNEWPSALKAPVEFWKEGGTKTTSFTQIDTHGRSHGENFA